jgi:predicted RecB family nuclease
MLPQTFAFSQSSLQDYADCARRFQLRYVQSQAWPGVQAEPVLDHERHVERGTRFHRLVERHQLGMEAAKLGALIADPDLRTWWQSYLRFDRLHQLGGRHYPEFTLSAELGGVRLTATYDLLVVQPGERLVIFDWKTSLRKLARQWYEARLQTRVYPYVLVQAGSSLWGGAVRPDQVSMIYWVAGAPDDPVVFEYDQRRFEQDKAYLEVITTEILARNEQEAWSLTADEARCKFCEYRSLCGRGSLAGIYTEFDMEDDNIARDRDGVLGLSDVTEVGF